MKRIRILFIPRGRPCRELNSRRERNPIQSPWLVCPRKLSHILILISELQYDRFPFSVFTFRLSFPLSLASTNFSRINKYFCCEKKNSRVVTPVQLYSLAFVFLCTLFVQKTFTEKKELVVCRATQSAIIKKITEILKPRSSSLDSSAS